MPAPGGPGGGPKSLPGKSGGMRPSFGGLGEGHLEEQAMQSAMQQKALGQKAGDSSQSTTGGSALQPGGQQKKPQQRKPRKVGTLKEELLNRPFKDAVDELKGFFSLSSWLGIEDNKDTTEEQMRKKKMHQRWQKLTQDEQRVAQEKYQKEMKKKQEEEREKQIKKQKEEQKKAQSIAPPSTPKSGPGAGMAGQKSNKGRAMQKLQMDRTSLGGAD